MAASVNSCTPDRVRRLLADIVSPTCDSSCQSDKDSSQGVNDDKALRGTVRSRPQDRSLFWDRVATYKTLTWFGKPESLSPLECARYGWENVTNDTLQCVSCKAFITGRMPTTNRPTVYQKCVEKLVSSLKSGHHISCPWTNNQSPEEFRSIIPVKRAECIQHFRERFAQLCCLGDSLPNLGQYIVNDLGLREDDLQNVIEQCISDPNTASHDVQQVSAALTLTGWKYSDSKAQMLQCDVCQREVGLWNFVSQDQEPSEDEEEEEEEEPCQKRSRNELLEADVSSDAISAQAANVTNDCFEETADVNVKETEAVCSEERSSPEEADGGTCSQELDADVKLESTQSPETSVLSSSKELDDADKVASSSSASESTTDHCDNGDSPVTTDSDTSKVNSDNSEVDCDTSKVDGDTSKVDDDTSEVAVDEMVACEITSDKDCISPVDSDTSEVAVDEMVACEIASDKDSKSPVGGDKSKVAVDEMVACEITSDKDSKSPVDGDTSKVAVDEMVACEIASDKDSKSPVVGDTSKVAVDEMVACEITSDKDSKSPVDGDTSKVAVDEMVASDKDSKSPVDGDTSKVAVDEMVACEMTNDKDSKSPVGGDTSKVAVDEMVASDKDSKSPVGGDTSKVAVDEMVACEFTSDKDSKSPVGLESESVGLESETEAADMDVSQALEATEATGMEETTVDCATAVEATDMEATDDAMEATDDAMEATDDAMEATDDAIEATDDPDIKADGVEGSEVSLSKTEVEMSAGDPGSQKSSTVENVENVEHVADIEQGIEATEDVTEDVTEMAMEATEDVLDNQSDTNNQSDTPDNQADTVDSQNELAEAVPLSPHLTNEDQSATMEDSVSDVAGNPDTSSLNTSQQQDSSVSEQGRSRTPKKRLRKRHRGFFHPLQEHQRWCPWVLKSKCGYDVEEKSDWKRLYEILTQQTPKKKVINAEYSSSPTETILFIRNLFNEWASP